MAVKNYLSGTEGKQHFNAAVSAKAEHVLVSFLYIQKQNGNILRQRKKKHPNIQFMVDSGAHTFQTHCHTHPVYRTWSMQDYENYLEAYTTFLRKNRNYIQCAVELDIDYPINVVTHQNDPVNNAYGSEVVRKWQDKYFRPLEDRGMEVIYVWHPNRGMPDWERMCSEFSYVGLPGEYSSQADFNKYITVARRYTTRIHGFAATKQSDFRDWPWYSIDSTTWKSSEIYGTLIHWDEHAQKLKFEQDKAKRAEYRRHFEKVGLDADAIIDERPGSYKLVTKYALISMVLMEKFYQRKYSTRIFYYEMRLPNPRISAVWDQYETESAWEKLRGDDVLRKDRNLSWQQKKDILVWISLIQYRDASVFNLAPALVFLEQYFEEFLKNNPGNIQALQKEISEMFAPPNPPPMQRTDPEHYEPTNNAPKKRDVTTLTAADLEWDVLSMVPQIR